MTWSKVKRAVAPVVTVIAGAVLVVAVALGPAVLPACSTDKIKQAVTGKSAGAEVSFPLQKIADDEWFDDRKDMGFAHEDDDVITVNCQVRALKFE